MRTRRPATAREPTRERVGQQGFQFGAIKAGPPMGVAAERDAVEAVCSAATMTRRASTGGADNLFKTHVSKTLAPRRHPAADARRLVLQARRLPHRSHPGGREGPHHPW